MEGAKGRWPFWLLGGDRDLIHPEPNRDRPHPSLPPEHYLWEMSFCLHVPQMDREGCSFVIKDVITMPVTLQRTQLLLGMHI